MQCTHSLMPCCAFTISLMTSSALTISLMACSVLTISLMACGVLTISLVLVDSHTDGSDVGQHLLHGACWVLKHLNTSMTIRHFNHQSCGLYTPRCLLSWQLTNTPWCLARSLLPSCRVKCAAVAYCSGTAAVAYWPWTVAYWPWTAAVAYWPWTVAYWPWTAAVAYWSWTVAYYELLL